MAAHDYRPPLRPASARSPPHWPRRPKPCRCRTSGSTPRISACAPGAPGDQSGALQRAIDEAARTRVPLLLAPGVYRAGGLTLPAGAQLAGVRGATRLIYTQGPSLLSAEHAETISLSGLTLDGGGQKLPEGRALAHFDDVAAMRITDCADHRRRRQRHHA